MMANPLLGGHPAALCHRHRVVGARDRDAGRRRRPAVADVLDGLRPLLRRRRRDVSSRCRCARNSARKYAAGELEIKYMLRAPAGEYVPEDFRFAAFNSAQFSDAPSRPLWVPRDEALRPILADVPRRRRQALPSARLRLRRLRTLSDVLADLIGAPHLLPKRIQTDDEFIETAEVLPSARSSCHRSEVHLRRRVARLHGERALRLLWQLWNDVDPRYLVLHLDSATNLPQMDENSSLDAYVVATLVPPARNRSGRTRWCLSRRQAKALDLNAQCPGGVAGLARECARPPPSRRPRPRALNPPLYTLSQSRRGAGMCAARSLFPSLQVSAPALPHTGTGMSSRGGPGG